MAQPPDIQWSEYYGDTSSEYFTFSHELSDGSLISGGNRYSIAPGATNYSHNCWLVKTNSSGDVLWNRTFGSDDQEYLYEGKETADGSLILIGRCENEGTGYSTWLINTDSEGEENWNRTYEYGEYSQGVDVYQTEDDGFIVLTSCFTESRGKDFRLIKTDSSGELEWTETYGEQYEESPNSLCKTSDGGYLMVGFTRSFSPSRDWAGWIVKTDSDGNELWNQVYEAGDAGIFNSVSPTTDGGYIVTGYCDGDAMVNLVWVVKTNSLGEEEWAQTYSSRNESKGISIQQTNDGGYIIIGNTRTWADSDTKDIFVIKTDSLGVTEWTELYGEDGDEEMAASICQTMDEGYFISGVKMNHNENIQGWLIRLEGVAMPPQPFSLLSPANNELLELMEPLEVELDWEVAFDPNPTDMYYNLTIHAQTTEYDSTIVNLYLDETEFTLSLPEHFGLVQWEETVHFDWSVIAYSDGDSVDCDSPFSFNVQPFSSVGENPGDYLPGTHIIDSVYPNPFNAQTVIKVVLPESSDLRISVTNVSGQIMKTISNGYFDAGIHKFTINAEEYASGIYFVSAFVQGRMTETRKILLIR